MAHKKKTTNTGKHKPATTEQYRKPAKSIRLRLRLAGVAESVAKGLDQNLTQYVNDALRMRLEKEQHWPPEKRLDNKAAGEKS